MWNTNSCNGTQKNYMCCDMDRVKKTTFKNNAWINSASAAQKSTVLTEAHNVKLCGEKIP